MNNLKYLRFILLIVIGILCGQFAFAEVRVFIDPPKGQLFYSEETALAVKIEGLTTTEPLRGYQVHLDFSDSYLELAGAGAFEEGSFLSDVGLTQWYVIPDGGGYTATCAILDFTPGASGSGTLFKLKLQAKDQSTGALGTDVTLSDIILRDPLNHPIALDKIEPANIVIRQQVRIYVNPAYEEMYRNGETTLAVKIEGLELGDAMRGYQVHLDFDETYLEVAGLGSFVEGEFLSDAGLTQWYILEENGGYTATCSILDYTPGATGEGTLFYVTLKAKTLATGPVGTDILLSDIILRDPLNHNIDYISQNGKIVILGVARIWVEPPLDNLLYYQSTTLAIKIEGLTENEALRGFQIHLDFDETYLEVAGLNAFVEGEFLSDVGLTQWYVLEENGGHTLTCSILDYTPGAYSTGTLFYVTLTAKDQSTGVDGTDIILSDVILRDPLNHGIAYTLEHGNIVIEAPLYIYTGLKVFLQGPYIPGTGGTMTHILQELDYIPLTSPYDPLLTLTAFPVVTPKYIVDWIYIQLRASATGAFEQPQSCFLLSDGMVVDVSGNPELEFDYTGGIEYYTIVQHRNHLEVMSAVPATFSSDPLIVNTADLTVLDSVYGGNVLGVKIIEPNVLALYSGDANADGEIVPTDFVSYWRVQTGQTGYYSADFNLDGWVLPTDQVNYWRPNTGRLSQIPLIQ